jgi:small-conductance mechanosensitive channel
VSPTALLDITLLKIGSNTLTVRSAIAMVVVFSLAWTLSWLLRRLVRRTMAQRGVQAEQGALGAVGRLAHYGILFFGLGVAMEVGGFSLSSLFAAGAFFAVGLGCAM